MHPLRLMCSVLRAVRRSKPTARNGSSGTISRVAMIGRGEVPIRFTDDAEQQPLASGLPRPIADIAHHKKAIVDDCHSKPQPTP
jgi:hypothetical protein